MTVFVLLLCVVAIYVLIAFLFGGLLTGHTEEIELSEAKKAKMALLEYIQKNPSTFGPVIKATDLQKSTPQKLDSDGQYAIGPFTIDIKEKSYQVTISAGVDNFWEDWTYEGNFDADANGKWNVNQPELISTEAGN